MSMFPSEQDLNLETPAFLFKYYTFNEYSLKSIREKNFWFNAPSNFNDPFDCRFDILDNVRIESSAPFSWNRAKAAGGFIIAPMLNDDQSAKLAQFMLNKLRSLRETAGVFCLSSTPYSVLMWSHYAAEHKGFCVVFERNEHNELGLKQRVCNKVLYQDSLTAVNNIDVLYCPEVITDKIFYSKAKSWEYEQEWRLVYFPGLIFVKASGLHPINAKIKGIIFGLNSTSDNIRSLVSLMKHEEVEFYKMQPIEHSVGLAIRLWTKNCS